MAHVAHGIGPGLMARARLYTDFGLAHIFFVCPKNN
jgi:hypothetical protein